MKKIWVAVTCLCMFSGALSATGGEMKGSILSGGECYHQSIDDKMAATFREWNPIEEDCPLSPAKAVSLAVAKLKAKLPKVTFVKVDYVRLERFGSDKPKHKDKWYYQINLYLHPTSEAFWEDEDMTTSREKGERDFATMFVSLDGSVPEILDGE